jgi:predicted flap endonuclease-1-like 5' DNA nuclease
VKSFQSRSREVRASSQELMRRLRAERLAASRRRRAAPPAALTPEPAEAPPACDGNDADTASSIMPSRKVRRATAPAAPQLAVADARPEPTVVAAVAAEAGSERKPKRVRKAKIDPTKIASKKVVPEAACEPVIEEPAVAAPVVEPIAQEKPVLKAKRAVARKPKPALSSAAEIIADGLAPVAALQEAVAAALATTTRPTEAPAAGVTLPITAIPSLGPGLVWRLNQCGIHTLADLAACEPDDLRGRLGRIGRIANVEQWIQHARSA